MYTPDIVPRECPSMYFIDMMEAGYDAGNHPCCISPSLGRLFLFLFFIFSFSHTPRPLLGLLVSPAPA